MTLGGGVIVASLSLESYPQQAVGRVAVGQGESYVVSYPKS